MAEFAAVMGAEISLPVAEALRYQVLLGEAPEAWYELNDPCGVPNETPYAKNAL
jgi:hypothetical protein